MIRKKLNILCAQLVGGAMALTTAAFAQSADISLAEQPLSEALRAVAQQTGANILFTPASVSGMRAHSLRGQMTALEAVQELIRGTGLEAVNDGNDGLLVRPVTSRSARLKSTGSAIALAAVASIGVATPAMAQDDLETVIVTGTSIRGIAPVGSNLISVGQQDIKSMGAVTVQDVLVNVPSLTGMGNVNQGTTNSSSYAPVVHQLGASASNSTLVLIDSHRMPSDGQNHGLTDPNMVPILMVQEVDVLPDGASSVYGSDAVAGVVNFITRKRYDGLQVTYQTGFADSYQYAQGGILMGKDWGDGSVVFSSSYSTKGALHNASRMDLANKDQRAKGGTNFNTFNCAPATIQINGAGNIYLSAASNTSVANTAANSPCYRTDGDFLQPEKRFSNMVKATQIIGRVSLGLDLLYSTRSTDAVAGLGTPSAVTVFSTGAQANPFYTNPPGVAGTKQTVRFDLSGLFPQTQTSTVSHSGNQVGYANFTADYNIDDNFHLTFSGLMGQDRLYGSSYGGICSACVNLALNGTTAAGGSTAAIVSVTPPASSTAVTMLPLTTANALDVWNPAATNRTSQAVRDSLTQGITTSDIYDQLSDFRVQLDGSPFELPGGPLRIAVGAESTASGEKSLQFGSGTLGPSTTAGTGSHFEYPRTVYAVYGEVVIPVVGPANNIPFVQKLDVDISGRYDHYSDVGETSNPKFAMNWDVAGGLRLRGTYSTSFVAPALDSIGKPPGYTANSAAFNVPVATYPNVTQLGVPGCTAGVTTCAVPSSFQGIILSGATNLVPAKGRGWSAGFDFIPDFLPGLTLNVTLFNAKFIGGVTSPNMAAATGASSLNSLLTFYPGGATPAQVQAFISGSGGNTSSAPVTGALPATIYYTWDFRQRNVLNLDIQGLDIYAAYKFETDIGSFTVSDALTQFLKYDEQFGAGGKTFSVLNTSGFNQTFPSIATQMRVAVSWNFGPVSAQIAANYTGSYRNWSSNALVPVGSDAFGNPSGTGGDHVSPSTVVDIHAAYAFNTGEPLLGEDEVYIDVKNLFDADAPFYNGTNGYNNFNWNPIGRMVSIGIRGQW